AQRGERRFLPGAPFFPKGERATRNAGLRRPTIQTGPTPELARAAEAERVNGRRALYRVALDSTDGEYGGFALYHRFSPDDTEHNPWLYPRPDLEEGMGVEATRGGAAAGRGGGGPADVPPARAARRPPPGTARRGRGMFPRRGRARVGGRERGGAGGDARRRRAAGRRRPPPPRRPL